MEALNKKLKDENEKLKKHMDVMFNYVLSLQDENKKLKQCINKEEGIPDDPIIPESSDVGGLDKEEEYDEEGGWGGPPHFLK